MTSESVLALVLRTPLILAHVAVLAHIGCKLEGTDKSCVLVFFAVSNFSVDLVKKQISGCHPYGSHVTEVI